MSASVSMCGQHPCSNSLLVGALPKGYDPDFEVAMQRMPSEKILVALPVSSVLGRPE